MSTFDRALEVVLRLEGGYSDDATDPGGQTRHGITEAVVAGVIGSYAYNMTMSLGAGAIVAPIGIADATLLHVPMVLTLGLLAVVIVLALRNGTLGRRESFVLFAGYPIFLIVSSI